MILPRPADGPEMLGEQWAATGGAVPMTLRVKFDFPKIILKSRFIPGRRPTRGQPVALEAGQVYRIALMPRGPDGGAANRLRATIFMPQCGGFEEDWFSFLVIPPDQIGRQWRHFEYVFKAPTRWWGRLFRISTYSERPIEVANVSLKRGSLDRPVNLGGSRPAAIRFTARWPNCRRHGTA